MSSGYDTILVIVCRLTKMALFIATRATDTSEDLAQLYLRHVFSKHGAPSDIVSDRGKTFVSDFWSSLCRLLHIKRNLSTAYHPETDGQTERLNQILEQYLRIYINYDQDDWYDLLPLAEFAYNNTPHSATNLTPFFANKGYHPRLEVSYDSVPSGAAQQLAQSLGDVQRFLREQLQVTRAQYESSTESRRAALPPFAVGDQVWLNTRNLRTRRPSKKLDFKQAGPFPIIEKISSHAFRLGLPLSMKRVHNVFHASLLEPAPPNDIPLRTESPPPPVEYSDHVEFEVAAILDSRVDRRRKDSGVLYLVQWAGFEGTAEEFSWEPVENVSNASAKVREFHRLHPGKPRPEA